MIKALQLDPYILDPYILCKGSYKEVRALNNIAKTPFAAMNADPSLPDGKIIRQNGVRFTAYFVIQDDTSMDLSVFSAHLPDSKRLVDIKTSLIALESAAAAGDEIDLKLFNIVRARMGLPAVNHI